MATGACSHPEETDLLLMASRQSGWSPARSFALSAHRYIRPLALMLAPRCPGYKRIEYSPRPAGRRTTGARYRHVSFAWYGPALAAGRQIGRHHVCTPVPNTNLVSRLLLTT